MKPDFNVPNETGQLWLEERQALFDFVLKHKPDKVFEIGTWRGMGSTYFIATALSLNKKGHLWTAEICESSHNIAKAFYSAGGKLEELAPYVTLLLGRSLDILPPVLTEQTPIDIAFVDGGFAHDLASAETQLQELWMLRPFIKLEGHVLIHDYDIGKSLLTRTAMEYDDTFVKENVIRSLAIFRKVKPYVPDTRTLMS